MDMIFIFINITNIILIHSWKTMEEKLNQYFITLRKVSHILLNKFIRNGGNTNCELKLSQMRALSAFKDNRPLLMKELAHNSGVKLSNMTTMIDDLIKEGFAKREKDESDRRKVLVHLTPKGKRIRAKFLANRRETAHSIFSKLSETDKNELLTSFDKVCKILEKSLAPDEYH